MHSNDENNGLEKNGSGCSDSNQEVFSNDIDKDQLDSCKDSDSENELIQLRGEGRYFGNAVPDEVLGPICRNCHERGHIAAKCKVVVCESCGERNSHYTRHCPKIQKCTNCGEAGHLRSDCKSRTRIIYCSCCESRNHTEDRCPDIWRSYKLANRNPYYPKNISCYNCAGKDHYGDECPNPRPIELRYIEESAFTGKNLEAGLSKRYDKSIKDLVPMRARSFSTLNYHNNNKRNFDRYNDRETKSRSDIRKRGSNMKKRAQQFGGKAKSAFRKRR